jgi:uncharacterized membrane protein YjjP (DUF1212 family)
MALSSEEQRELQAFLVRLGAAMNAADEPVYVVQQTLRRVAAAYGMRDARISALPTSLFVSLGGGESATLELTTPLASGPRLDQIAALHRLVSEAERGAVRPAEGLRRLDELRGAVACFGAFTSLAGYAVLAIGIAMILEPAPREIVAAALFGVIVGGLRLATRTQATLQILLPVIAAFAIASLTALVIKHDLANPGLRALIASLVVFLPGAALTTAVLELAGGEMIAGSSRLVWAGVQLALLAFGILAGVEAAGIPPATVFTRADDPLGDWTPWAGVLIFAVGVFVSNFGSPEIVRAFADRALRCLDRPVRRERGLRRLRERPRRRACNDARGDARRPVARRHARICVLPSRLLAARSGSDESHRPDRARRGPERRRKRRLPRGDRIDLRGRARRSLRDTARAVVSGRDSAARSHAAPGLTGLAAEWLRHDLELVRRVVEPRTAVLCHRAVTAHDRLDRIAA